MATPRVLILRAPGTNCDQETAFAFQRAGGRPDLVHINRLLESPDLPDAYQILCLPGGFSYGDDVAAGRILAGQIRHHLAETMARFKDGGRLVLGICNGFQVLIKSGILLPDDPSAGPAATLTWNDSGRFEDRWVHLAVDSDKCVFLRGIESIELPIAHAEGKFVPRDDATLQSLAAAGQLALRYCEKPVGYACATGSASAPRTVDSSTGGGSAPPRTLQGAVPFPANPNGSVANVAGVCDVSGRVFGLMPHPERFIEPTHHPQWTRRPTSEVGQGLKIFENAVGFFG